MTGKTVLITGGASGIGLAMVYNLVTTAEGSIEFKTTPGKGTTFYLRLPLHS